MQPVAKVLSAPLKAIGLIPKMPKLPAPLPTVQRDEAAATIQSEDEIRRRRGGAADIVTGAGGAEPAQATGKTTLG